MPNDENMTLSHGYAQLDGIRLHYAETGKHHPDLVLLIHGFPEFWYSWRHQLAALGEHYHVVAPDMRGYNLSERPLRVEDYAMEVLVKDVIGLIDYFGAEKAAVVGHDWGAGIAWAVAQMHPERVSKLAVMQVPPAAAWRANLTFKQFMKSWYMLFFQLPRVPEFLIGMRDLDGIDRTFRDKVVTKGAFSDSDIERYKEAMRRPGALTAAVNYYRANVGRVFRKPDVSEAARDSRVQAPTLFIFAEQDFAIIPATVRGVGKFVNAPYTELRIPESGHWVQNEAPEKVNEALLKFLAEG